MIGMNWWLFWKKKRYMNNCRVSSYEKLPHFLSAYGEVGANQFTQSINVYSVKTICTLHETGKSSAKLRKVQRSLLQSLPVGWSIKLQVFVIFDTVLNITSDAMTHVLLGLCTFTDFICSTHSRTFQDMWVLLQLGWFISHNISAFRE